MGIFDRSSSTTNQTLVDQTLTETRQVDQSGQSGLAFADVAGGVSVALSSTTNLSASDQGAIDAGRELGLAGIGSARAANDSLANSYGQSLTALQRYNSDSLSLLGALASDSIDASKTLARDSAASSRSFLDDAVAGFGALAKQSSTSSDERIAKIVGLALAAVAAVVVLPALFKGGAAKAVI